MLTFLLINISNIRIRRYSQIRRSSTHCHSYNTFREILQRRNRRRSTDSRNRRNRCKFFPSFTRMQTGSTWFQRSFSRNKIRIILILRFHNSFCHRSSINPSMHPWVLTIEPMLLLQSTTIWFNWCLEILLLLLLSLRIRIQLLHHATHSSISTFIRRTLIHAIPSIKYDCSIAWQLRWLLLLK